MAASIARQYWSLTKPRVVALIVFTAVIGMFLAAPGLPPLREALFGTLGIWLAASSAAAINQLLDSRIDAQMARTSWRPLVSGTLTPRQALLFALVLAALSMTVIGNAYARWWNRPGAIIRVPGIIMLVPGSASLRGLLSLIQAQDMEAGQEALLTVMNILLALVAGLLFGNLLLPARRNL